MRSWLYLWLLLCWLRVPTPCQVAQRRDIRRIADGIGVVSRGSSGWRLLQALPVIAAMRCSMKTCTSCDNGTRTASPLYICTAMPLGSLRESLLWSSSKSLGMHRHMAVPLLLAASIQAGAQNRILRYGATGWTDGQVERQAGQPNHGFGAVVYPFGCDFAC